MAWNVTVCTSANPLKMNCSQNHGERVLGMVSPQVSTSFRDGESQANGGGSPKRHFYTAFDQQDEAVEEDQIDDTLQPVEKKRRLTSDQVKFLEMSFELENKLEPERKSVIAKQLGLQPRQVAVWFQNRRARWKTKQLERDFDALKNEYNAILEENKKLQAEVARLTSQLQRPQGKQEAESEKEGNDLHHKVASQIESLNTDTTCAGDQTEALSFESGKSDLGSVKSDSSEVLDSGSYSPAMARGCETKTGDTSFCPVVKIEESPVIAAEEHPAFVNIYNPYLIQQLAVKVESGLFHEDSYSFLFSWDDQPMLPLYEA